MPQDSQQHPIPDDLPGKFEEEWDPTYLTDSAQIASPVALQQVFVPTASLVQGKSCNGKPTWWDVQIWGYGAEQTLVAGATGVAPDPGFLKSSQHTVPLRARVLYEGDQVDFDIGAGMRIAIYARNLNLQVLAPVGSVAIKAPGQGGLVNTPPVAPIQQQDSLIYGQIGQVDAPIGQRLAKLTEVRNITGASQFIPIPQRARFVQIFQNTPGPGGPLNWRTNTLSLLDLGQVDFLLTVSPNMTTDAMQVPGRATILDPGAPARVLTLVWSLEL